MCSLPGGFAVSGLPGSFAVKWMRRAVIIKTGSRQGIKNLFFFLAPSD
ncbi:hypothetical protein [Salmonella phage vB_SenS_SB10]|uniref:Uncharacterized protein n=1 Tax=Salmonella phage vB_SenS_SB10 TaxID=2591134 RepID=A0A5J6TB25_9CAUD|nr:hypothetical protein [Salmonella phage vB_SenS_SB10]